MLTTGGMVQSSQQHVVTCVKEVEYRAREGLRIVTGFGTSRSLQP